MDRYQLSISYIKYKIIIQIPIQLKQSAFKLSMYYNIELLIQRPKKFI